MENVIWFDRIRKEDVSSVGGKGANLGEMVSIGMPVPLGFAVTTKSFDDFIINAGIADEIDRLIRQTNVDDTHKLIETSNKIKQLIISKEMPAVIKNKIVEAYKNLSYSDKIEDEKLISLISAGRDMALVAVRSSATTEDLPTASFAGQQATYLNIKGIKDLLENVKKCWASLFEPRAIFYRSKQKFTHSSISVIIQKMVNAEKSGVMFTRNPTSGDDTILIEATWGLGEMLVSGEVNPDSYTLGKDGKILAIEINHKEKMKIRDSISDLTVELNIPENKTEAQVLLEDLLILIFQFRFQLIKWY